MAEGFNKPVPPPKPARLPAPPPVPTRIQRSCDSFPALTDADRKLLQQVLATSRDYMQQTTRRLDRHESDIAQLRDAVGQVKATNDDIREDVRGLRQDIQSLTSTLLSNMRDDQQRERDMGSLKEQIAVIVSTEGAKAGSKAGAAAGIKWALGTVATMLPSLTAIFWLYAWLHGLNSPPVFRP